MFRTRYTRAILVIAIFSILLTGLIGLAFAKHYYAEKVIGPRGGRLHTSDGTALIIPRRALKKRTLISMEVISDGESRVEFCFEPDGLRFRRPVIIKLSWKTLKDVEADELILYDENGNPVSEAIWDRRHKRAIFTIWHFSRYYFDRR